MSLAKAEFEFETYGMAVQGSNHKTQQFILNNYYIVDKFVELVSSLEYSRVMRKVNAKPHGIQWNLT